MLEVFSMSIVQGNRNRSHTEVSLPQDGRSRKYVVHTPPCHGPWFTISLYHLSHYLWVLLTDVGTSSSSTLPGECAQFSLCLTPGTIISKNKSFSILLCPKPVAQILAVQWSSKAAHGSLGDQRTKALWATSDGIEEQSLGASCWIP